MAKATPRHTDPPSPTPTDPPEPPDSPSPMAEDNQRFQSFKEALIDKENTLNQIYEVPKEHTNMEEESEVNNDTITLTKDKKRRLYQPRCLFVIIKVFGKRLMHAYLKSKLANTWKLTEPLTLIYLGWDYHIVKLSQVQSMHKILHEGPWFVTGNFLSVKKWEPNFVP
ncbi:hypothetical protein RDI58_026617 [Solanum bulbocastanum]|uniref:DUF4283 domain-containing protein n=1 Tax=Solanum bulbocastanum TaxID=147425 RepID=A0AAN8Y1C3_SOLBU